MYSTQTSRAVEAVNHAIPVNQHTQRYDPYQQYYANSLANTTKRYHYKDQTKSLEFFQNR